MKKTFLFVAALAATMMAQADVIVDETFTDFPTGWTASGSVTTGTDRAKVAALTYTDAMGAVSALSGQGNAVQTALDVSDKYQHTKSLPNAVTECYVSFLLRADGQQKQAQTQVFGLGSPTMAMRLWIGKGVNDATKCRLGVTRSSGTGGDVQWAASEFAPDEVMLIVLKYTMTATDTIASLYINPAIGGTEPATPAALDNTKGAGKCKKSLTNMTFYTTGSSKSYFTVGGARVCTTWAEAVAAGQSGPGEDPDYANSIIANFTDSLVWTNRVDAAPASGSFPTDTLNNYILTATAVVKSGKTWYVDEDSTMYVKFVSRAHMDKNTFKASIETPWVASVDTLFLYGHSGSDDKNFKIETRVANGKWETLTTLTNMKADQLFAVPVEKSNIKLRISNETGSAQYFFYIGTINPETMAQHKEPTAVEEQKAAKATKAIVNGKLVILKNGVRYNAVGAKF